MEFSLIFFGNHCRHTCFTKNDPCQVGSLLAIIIESNIIFNVFTQFFFDQSIVKLLDYHPCIGLSVRDIVRQPLGHVVFAGYTIMRINKWDRLSGPVIRELSRVLRTRIFASKRKPSDASRERSPTLGDLLRQPFPPPP
jgi:hypothetical protein